MAMKHVKWASGRNPIVRLKREHEALSDALKGGVQVGFFGNRLVWGIPADLRGKWLEFGTSGGRAGPLPSRPFLAASVEALRTAWTHEIIAAVNRVSRGASGKAAGERVLRRFGALAVEVVRESMDEYGVRDTGALRKAVEARSGSRKLAGGK